MKGDTGRVETVIIAVSSRAFLFEGAKKVEKKGKN